MEGLQLRSVKLVKRGEPVEEVYRIIENNTRQPVELMGDIAAQHAGCILGRDLVAELVDKYGVTAFERAVEIILDQSEAAARALIRSMPDGVYTSETFLDNDRAGDEPLPIRIRVIVDGDEMTIDYSGIADQVKGPINSGWFGGGQTTARVAFKYLLGADEMANEGTFRPLKLVLPPGKILSADPTAPMGNYSTPFPTVIDAVIKALEQALPQRVPGGHFGTHSGVRFHGRRADGSFFGTHDSGHGGWGACATHDGSGPFRTMAHGDTRIIPLELQETYLPVRIEQFALREDSGGAGEFRGGLGFRKTYRMLAHAACRPISTAPSSRPGACKAAAKACQDASRWWTLRPAGSGRSRRKRACRSAPATSSAWRPVAAAVMVRHPRARLSASSATLTRATFPGLRLNAITA
jgi:N-methylhydantoinase B